MKQSEYDKAVLDSLKTVMKSATAPKVIKHAGEVNWAEVNGERVFRQEAITIPDMGTFRCAPTDNHFVYRYTKRLGWTLFCTCGSPAVIVDPDAYKHLGGNQGKMIVCYSLLLSKRHSDGSQ